MAAEDAVLEAAPASSVGKAREFFGHPRGVAYVAGTEFWDRVSFHGMQALLVLYMVEYLLLPGHVEHVAGLAAVRAVIESVTGPLSPQALAAQIFGLYVGFVYLLCVGGGLLGDRVLGRRLAVALGAMLMAAGHFCMAFGRAYLAALLLIIRAPPCCAEICLRSWERCMARATRAARAPFRSITQCSTPARSWRR